MNRSTFARDQKTSHDSSSQAEETLTNTMINYIQKANSNQEEDADDELDLTFAGIAMQMRLHLDATQRQRVLNKIQTLVGNCIDNVLEGLPLMGAPQQPLCHKYPSVHHKITYICQGSTINEKPLCY